MLIHAQAQIPLQSELLSEALREFAAFVKRHLVAADGSEVSIALTETSARGNATLARSLPDDTPEFGLDWIPRGETLNAAEFRRAVEQQKPKKTRSQLRLQAQSIQDVPGLAEALADSLPDSGRGVMLLFYLTGWKLVADAHGPAVDATFSRFRHGARSLSASLGLRFQALSLKDPIVPTTIAAAAKHVGLRFGKPMAAFAPVATAFPSAPAPVMKPDPRLEPPSAEAQLIVQQNFDEALARAADRIGAHAEDLDALPLLFSRYGSGEKRIRDVMAGKKEKIDLPSHLKRFVSERFPDYGFDASDPEQLWFRKQAAPTLDLLLMFDRIHHWGLGKSFSLEFAADFPNTPFGGLHTGGGGTRANLFQMFHQGWEKQVWTYTTSQELATALGGCGTLLARVLPALEEQCRDLLLPPPIKLPEGIEQRGALSAREAYEQILPIARAWATDSQVESIGSTNRLSHREGLASSITREGRLLPHGSWSFKVISKSRDMFCHYTVPHTGRIQWNYYAVPQGGVPKYSAVFEGDNWIDSTEIAERAFAAVERHLDGFRISHIWLALHDRKRYSGKFIWEAQCIALGKAPSERRDINVQLDPITGEIL